MAVNGRSPVLQQSRMLFLLITDITNPFYTALARGAEDAARKSGYSMIMGNSDENQEMEKAYVDTILAIRVDGVLMVPAGDASLPHLDALRRHNVPFVLLDREVPGVDSDIVLGDSKESGRTLVEHLASLGHRRIAMINGSNDVSSARLRLEGYREALTLNDLLIEKQYILETTLEPRSNLAEIEYWLCAMSSPPTAIVAGNNALALQVIRALAKRGKSVPDDVSLVCFDDLGPYPEIDTFMTVISRQAYQFGYIGTQLLIERIQDRSSPPQPLRKVVLPGEMIVRRSVADLTCSRSLGKSS
ncbi:substrate-binding domain-containing protein [Cohnella nanjingensis]|nr:substrate-binding domain-containing protein [Cohnella nanjingensis]